MTDLDRHFVLAGAGALALARPASPLQAQAQTPHAMADFFKPDDTLMVSLSPDGRRLAVLREIREGERRRALLDVISAADPGGARTRVPIGDVEAQGMEWGDDTHVLLRVTSDVRVRRGRPMDSNIERARLTVTSRRVLSVNADTGRAVAMFGGERVRMRRSLDLGYVVDIRADRPSHILMAAWDEDGLGLYRANIVNGDTEFIERGALRTTGWKTVDGVAVLRRDISQRGDVESWYARAPGAADWKFVRRNRLITDPDFTFAGPSETPGAIRVLAQAPGEDVIALRDMDLATLAFGPPLHERAGRDAEHAVHDADRRLVGTAFMGERLEYQFADASLTAHHRAMNRFFENGASVRLIDVDRGHERLLTYVVGPREPGAWYFYDKTARVFINIATRGALDGARLGPARILSAPTRDGQTIEAYLTAPPNQAPGPLVALIHGGPETRDRWGFDRQAQVLAAHGFWVVQPNFRGSGGYGQAFEFAGRREWGQRIQRDIEDAVLHAVKETGPDANRVAIMGTSFGGYSALMSPVLRPNLYKAAISICGVSDLPELLSDEHREDAAPQKPVYSDIVRRVGHPETDRAMLEQASPRRRAAEIAYPVLLVHGVHDRIAPVFQSRRMRDALQRAGKRVELIEVADAGHADWEDEEEQRLMTRYVAFLRAALA